MCGYIGKNKGILQHMASTYMPLSEWPFGLYVRLNQEGLMVSKMCTLFFGKGIAKHSTDGERLLNGYGEQMETEIVTEFALREALRCTRERYLNNTAFAGTRSLIPTDLKDIFTTKEEFPRFRQGPSSTRTSGTKNPSNKVWGKTRDAQIKLSNFQPEKNRPPLPLGQFSQWIFTGTSKPSKASRAKEQLRHLAGRARRYSNNNRTPQYDEPDSPQIQPFSIWPIPRRNAERSQQRPKKCRLPTVRQSSRSSLLAQHSAPAEEIFIESSTSSVESTRHRQKRKRHTGKPRSRSSSRRTDRRRRRRSR